jgi:hypothetical protein
MGFMQKFNFMGRALLFGTIKMPNFANIYRANRNNNINGVIGKNLGLSNGGLVNGVAAYTELQGSNIIQAGTPEDACANPPTTIYSNSTGEINAETLIFGNQSGFSQEAVANQYFRSEGATPTYQVDASRGLDGNGYFPLNYVNDCVG